MEWRIYPLDVVFFRGPAPMNAGEGGVIASLFPPSPEVLQGLVRSALLTTLGVSFAEYAAAVRAPSQASAAAREAVAAVGSAGGDLGQLQLRGPYLVREGESSNGARTERWYPAPLDLRPQGCVWRAIGPGNEVATDLGTVRLLDQPLPPDPAAWPGGPPAIEASWISEAGLARYLAGQEVPANQVRSVDVFGKPEPRVGIGRDPTSRAARDQMLYAPQFVRLTERGGRVGIAVRVDGVDEALQQRCAGLQRFGGEGHLVEVVVAEEGALPHAPTVTERGRLVALTPVRWGGGVWLPTSAGPPWWLDAGGVRLRVTSAAIGKPLRIGGWDIVAGRPKPAAACVPAGSVWYVETAGAQDLATLHDTCIGTRTAAGFGHVLVGAWREGDDG